MAINLSNIRNELRPGLFDVRGEYDNIEKQYTKIFTTKKSKMNVERSTQMRFLGLPSLKAEGGAIDMDNNAGERFVWNFYHQEVALGYAITRPTIDDNLYKSQFNPTNLGLQRVFAQYKEITAANILNNCTTAITGQGGDAKALAATDHPYDFGTWANTSSTPMALGEATLTSVLSSIRRNFIDEAGIRIFARGRTLVIPNELQSTAIRLLRTELRPGTANNDVNALLTIDGSGFKDFVILDHLSSAYKWFVCTNIDGMIHMERIPFEMDMWVDNLTDNLLVKGYERYSFGFNDPRALWCETPTS